MSGLMKLGEVMKTKDELQTGTPPKIQLHDAHAIRREMASVYRDMRAGSIETSDGTKLAYVLSMMIKAYEAAVLEERLERMENTINRRIKK